MKQLLLLPFLFISVISFGQGWEKTFGGGDRDYGKSVQQTADGGYIITGAFGLLGNGDSDVYLIKTDSQGDTLWTKTFGGSYDDYGNSVQQTSDGGYIVAGFFDEGVWTGGCELGDGWILKLNQNGDTLWTKKFDNNGKCDCFNNIEISSDLLGFLPLFRQQF